MIDTPDMFSIDISIKNSDIRANIKNNINVLLNEAKSLVQKNYFNKKIIHTIVKNLLLMTKNFLKSQAKK